MKLATWNVNSLKVRLPHVLDWVSEHAPDILCLQETKCEDANFPKAEIEAAGYHVIYAGQRSYNGVAILSKTAASEIVTRLPNFEDESRRVIAATYGDVRIICLYVPNGQSVGSEKFQYKMLWLEALKSWLEAETARYPKLAVLGDFNIAPEPRDVHDPAVWEGCVMFSDAERAVFQHLLALRFVDSYRLFEQPEKEFSWWDYRMGAFRRNLGLRIDHILLSPALAAHCRTCQIDKAPRRLERPSDHAPVLADIDIAG